MRWIIPVLMLALVACAPPEEAASPTIALPGTSCVSAFTQAGRDGADPEATDPAPPIGSLSEAGDRLDGTILNCRSVDEWTQEAERVGIELDEDPEEFLRERCQANGDVAVSPVCAEVGAGVEPAPS